MRIEQLYYLVEVTKNKSINLTAERIHVTQPTISEAIRNLEKELEATLLNRTRQGVELTEAGVKTVNTAVQILDLVEELKSQLKTESQSNNYAKPPAIEGNLTINSVPSICMSIMPEISSKFIKKFPNVFLDIRQKSHQEIVEEIANGEADIGLVSIVINNELFDKIVKFIADHELYFEKILDSNLYVYVSASSPLSKRKYISLKELLEYPMIIHEPGPFRQQISTITEFLSKYGKPNIISVCNTSEMYSKTIIDGLAVGFGMFSSTNYQEIVPLKVKENIKILIGWIKPGNRTLSPAAKEFVNILRNKFPGARACNFTVDKSSNVTAYIP